MAIPIDPAGTDCYPRLRRQSCGSQTSFKIVLDLFQEPFDPVRLGFVGQHLGLQYLIKQAAIGARPHALGLIGKRFSNPDTDAQGLPQFVGSPECPLPRVFVLARVSEPIAMSAQKIAARAVKLGDAASAISTVSRSRADEIGATAAEPTMQMDDADGLGHSLPFPISSPHGVGEMHPLSLSA